MITILHLGTVRQNQDAEKRVLSRKSERRAWRKREGVWRKNNICGENVKNAGEKKLYYAPGPGDAMVSYFVLPSLAGSLARLAVQLSSYPLQLRAVRGGALNWELTPALPHRLRFWHRMRVWEDYELSMKLLTLPAGRRAR